MGHALAKAHRLLNPGGALIESHFSGKLTVLEVHHNGRVRQAEPVQHTGNFKMFKQAKAALDRAVNDGLFLPETQRVFDDLVYADSFNALHEWVAEQVKSLIIDDRLAKKVEALLLEADGPTAVALRRQMRMGRLKRG